MILPEYKIELAVAATGETRAGVEIQGVKYEPEANRLVATDGHILATVPVKTELNDEPGIIPVGAFRVARKFHRETRPARIRTCGGMAEVWTDTRIGIRVQARLPLVQGQFPNYQSLFPAIPTSEPPLFTLDAELLYRLAKAVAAKNGRGARWVTVWRDPTVSEAAMLVLNGDPGTAGLLVPGRIDSKGYETPFKSDLEAPNSPQSASTPRAPSSR